MTSGSELQPAQHSTAAAAAARTLSVDLTDSWPGEMAYGTAER